MRVMATCSQCKRGMHEQCFVVVEGDAGRVQVDEEGDRREQREWLQGRQHDSWKVREMEGSEWPP